MHSKSLKYTSYSNKREFVKVRWDFEYMMLQYHKYFYPYLGIMVLVHQYNIDLYKTIFFGLSFVYYYSQYHVVDVLKDDIKIFTKI